MFQNGQQGSIAVILGMPRGFVVLAALILKSVHEVGTPSFWSILEQSKPRRGGKCDQAQRCATSAERAVDGIVILDARTLKRLRAIGTASFRPIQTAHTTKKSNRGRARRRDGAVEGTGNGGLVQFAPVPTGLHGGSATSYRLVHTMETMENAQAERHHCLVEGGPDERVPPFALIPSSLQAGLSTHEFIWLRCCYRDLPDYAV